MIYSRRVEIFNQVRVKYNDFMISVLWKLTGDRELFAEALQYALLGIWQNIEKLDSKKAGAYIYRIALSANSKAWRKRVGRDGQINQDSLSLDKPTAEKADTRELTGLVRQMITKLPDKQAKAIVMRYLEQKDYPAVAEHLKCSEPAARSHVSKALATLRTRLVKLTEEVQ